MPIYWRLEDFPELTPLSPAKRQELWVAVAPKVYRDPKVLLLLIPFFGCIALGNILGDRFFSFRFGSALGGGLGGGLAVFTLTVGAFQFCRPHLIREIERREQMTQFRNS